MVLSFLHLPPHPHPHQSKTHFRNQLLQCQHPSQEAEQSGKEIDRLRYCQGLASQGRGAATQDQRGNRQPARQGWVADLAVWASLPLLLPRGHGQMAATLSAWRPLYKGIRDGPLLGWEGQGRTLAPGLVLPHSQHSLNVNLSSSPLPPRECPFCASLPTKDPPLVPSGTRHRRGPCRPKWATSLPWPGSQPPLTHPLPWYCRKMSADTIQQLGGH